MGNLEKMQNGKRIISTPQQGQKEYFFISSKGYGLLIKARQKAYFDFGKREKDIFEFGSWGEKSLEFYFITGSPSELVKRYYQINNTVAQNLPYTLNLDPYANRFAQEIDCLKKEQQANGTPVSRPVWFHSAPSSRDWVESENFLLGKNILLLGGIDTTKKKKNYLSYFPEGEWYCPPCHPLFFQGAQINDVTESVAMKNPGFIRKGSITILSATRPNIDSASTFLWVMDANNEAFNCEQHPISVHAFHEKNKIILELTPRTNFPKEQLIEIVIQGIEGQAIKKISFAGKKLLLEGDVGIAEKDTEKARFTHQDQTLIYRVLWNGETARLEIK